MPISLREFETRLNDLLDVEAYAADAAVQGLQVGPEDGTVATAAFAVDGVVATIEAAAERGADVLVVHHGISWGGIDAVTGTEYDRVAALVENDLALYAAHTPLDGHDEVGNAALLAEHLDLDAVEPFGEFGGVHVGQRARADEPRPVEDLRDDLTALETGGQPVQVLDFGPDTVDDVAILTGSGTDWLDEARDAGVDALITGEGKQPAYHEAREAGINVFLAGHYATETFGVRALSDRVDDWDEVIGTTYIEHPTGL